MYDGCIFIKEGNVSTKQEIQDGDILICTANGSLNLVGKSAIVWNERNRRLTFGAFMNVFRCYDKSYASFVSKLFQSAAYKNQVQDLLAGSAINNLKGKDIENFVFNVPDSRKEQIVIAGILTDMDDEIAALQREHTKYTLIKQGMMQKLLTGQIRLPQPCQSQE